MNVKRVKRNVVLGILFLLPVVFLLFLYPSTHNYNPLDIVKNNIADINHVSETVDTIALKDHLTVLGFYGVHPMEHLIAASNLKELVYDKFKGFKNFQIVIVLPENTQNEANLLRKEISRYEDLKYWQFVFVRDNEIETLHNSLIFDKPLDADLSTDQVFIIDKELNQRGRLDDRTDRELKTKAPIYSLNSYNCIAVAEIKNKMSEDLRILFTEYRQKRKGNFDSSTRRDNQLKKKDEQN